MAQQLISLVIKCLSVLYHFPEEYILCGFLNFCLLIFLKSYLKSKYANQKGFSHLLDSVFSLRRKFSQDLNDGKQNQF